MLDSDLAKLYGVDTKILNQAVKRNDDRFPEDFMFTLNQDELNHLRFSNEKIPRVRYFPNVFTESGIAMLSSVLNSKKAIHVNISIIRTFIRLRSFLAMESSLQERIGLIEQNSTKLFKSIFTRLDNIEEDLAPKLPANRKKIGLKNK